MNILIHNFIDLKELLTEQGSNLIYDSIFKMFFHHYVQASVIISLIIILCYILIKFVICLFEILFVPMNRTRKLEDTGYFPSDR